MTLKVKLADVAVINPRLTARPSPQELVSFLGMADVDAEHGTTMSGQDRTFAETAKGYTQFIDKDIIVAKITPCFENGKIAQATLRKPYGAGSTEFHVIRPDRSLLDDRYLLNYLRQPYIRTAGERQMTGSAGQRRIPASFLSDLPIPLPALPEQCRIANVLDLIAALCAKRRAAIALLNDLAQAIFLDMFGDLPKLEVRPLGDVADIRSGITKGRRVATRISLRAVPYLAVLNVQDKRLDLAYVKTINATEAEIDRYRLIKNDLLLTEGGDPDKLGRGTLWNNEIVDCIHQNHIFRVRIQPSAPVEPMYLNWLVSSSYGKRYFLSSAKQTTGIASINSTQLHELPVPIPPRPAQAEFTQKIKELSRLIGIYSDHLKELETLFASLRQWAFGGGLREFDTSAASTG